MLSLVVHLLFFVLFPRPERGTSQKYLPTFSGCPLVRGAVMMLVQHATSRVWREYFHVHFLYLLFHPPESQYRIVITFSRRANVLRARFVAAERRELGGNCVSDDLEFA